MGGVLLPAPGRSQLVFDWPIRAGVAPEALLAGAAATLWNPAGTALEPGEAWITSVDGPKATELRGVAGAVSGGVSSLGTLGLAFTHLGIDDIPRTVDSPAGEPGQIRVAEDALALAASRRLAPWISAGVGGRWVRATVLDDRRSRTTASAGFRLDPSLAFRPALALTLLDLGGDERLMGAVSAAVPPPWIRPFQLTVGYGFDAASRTGTVDQRVSLRLTWMARFHAGAGFTFPDGEDEGVNALWSAGADFGRYSLAVLREGLSNDFGAVHYYRAAIRF